MKAAVCYEIGKPLVIEEGTRAEPGKGDVEIRLAATAICHSDIHDWKGEMPGPTPFVGGHESAGYIDKVGAGVTSVKAGDPVVVSLLASCGTCYYCVTGPRHLCKNRFAPPPEPRVRNKKGQPLQLKGNVGGFAEYVVVNESQVVKVPKDIPLDRAALLACGVITGFGGVVNRAKVRPFQSVVVMGAGGAEFVFVTVGSVTAIKQGMSFTGPRGTTVLIGLPSFRDQLSFSPLEMIPEEKNLIGGFTGGAHL